MGAPESDAVVFLRTRLIVNARVKIVDLPNPLATRNAACPPGMDEGVAARVSGCLNVSFCLDYTNGARGFRDATSFGALSECFCGVTHLALYTERHVSLFGLLIRIVFPFSFVERRFCFLLLRSVST